MLSRDRHIYDPVAMLSQSSGLEMEDMCATTGNARQSDQRADQFVSPK